MTTEFNNWIVASKATDGIELRPHPRLVSRFAIFATCVNTVLASIVLLFVVCGCMMLAVIASTFLMLYVGLSQSFWIVLLTGHAIVVAILLAVFAGWKTYRRATSDQSAPLRILTDGTVIRENKTYVIGGLAVGICHERYVVTDDEDSSSVFYRVCLIHRDGERTVLPIPDTTLGTWFNHASRADAAVAFAEYVGIVLQIPVEGSTTPVEQS